MTNKELRRKKAIEYFGKPIEEMNLDEALMALSVMGSRVGNKDLEDISMQMLIDREHGMADDAVIAHAEDVMRSRGYSIPEDKAVMS